jgi:hypothetical protein
VSFKQRVGTTVVLISLGACTGCSLGPRPFRKITHPAPLVRARALSLGDRRPSAEVIPALVTRLNDPDVVVRMTAGEELKRRTGKDFGFVAWGTPEERTRAIQRWRAWLWGGPKAPVARPAAVPPRKTLPIPSPQR